MAAHSSSRQDGQSAAADATTDEDYYSAEEEFFDGDGTGPSWAMHREVFDGNTARLKSLLRWATPEDISRPDPHGNTPLHVAVLRGHVDCVRALLGANAPALAANARGWTPLMEAVSLQQQCAAHLLGAAEAAQAKAEVKAKKAELLATLAELPDFSMQLHWEVGSSLPGVGLLLRKYAPSDTYTIWKVGSCIRVDGSLMGLKDNEEESSVVPHWKRGHFSIIYDGRRAAAAARSAAAAAGGGNGDSGGGGRGLSTAAVPSAPPPSAAPPPPPPPLPQQQGQQEEEQPQEQQRSTQLWFLDHVKGTYIDVSSYTKELKGEAAEVVAEGVDELLADGVVEAVKVKSAGGVKFKPVKGWFGGEVNELVDGWSTKVYEASGCMVQVTRTKASFRLPEGLTFEEYLALAFPEDAISEIPLNLLTLAAGDVSIKRKKKKKKGKKAKSVRTAPPRAEGGCDGGVGGSGSAGGLDGGSVADASEVEEEGGSDEDGSDEEEEEEEEEEGEEGDAVARELETAMRDAELHADAETTAVSSSSGGGGGNAKAEDITDGAAASPSGRDGGGGAAACVAGVISDRKDRSSAAGASSSKAPSTRGSGGAAPAAASKGAPRKFTARCWMAEDFPLSLKQLLPLLEVVGSGNKVLAKVGRFMAKYGDMQRFPVRLQVPLFMTVYISLAFKRFTILGNSGGSNSCGAPAAAAAAAGRAAASGSTTPPRPSDDPLGPGFFEVPPGYKQKIPKDLLERRAERADAAAAAAAAAAAPAAAAET